MIDQVANDPERLARIAAHRARIERELAQGIAEEQASIQRIRKLRNAKRSPPLNFAGRLKPKPKPRRLTRHQKWQKYWMDKLDRIEAMARNPGWSVSAVR